MIALIVFAPRGEVVLYALLSAPLALLFAVRLRARCVETGERLLVQR